MQNFTRIDFQFLDKGFDKKQLALITNLDYKYRIRSNKGILKNKLCKMSGIAPENFSRAIKTIEAKTNQQFNYDQKRKQINNAFSIYHKSSSKAHIQVPTYFVSKRVLKSSDLTVFGYLKAVGGSWNGNGSLLTKTFNAWLDKKGWNNLKLSYISVLSSLRKLRMLNLINTYKHKMSEESWLVYRNIEVIDNSDKASYERIKETLEKLNEDFDSGDPYFILDL